MKRTSTPHRAWWLLLLILLAASTPAAGLLFSYSSSGAPPTAGEHTDKSTTAPDKNEGIVCFGQVDLRHGVTALVPLQPGRVTEVLVEEGQTVDGGAPLIRLDDASARSRVTEAQVLLEEAKLRLKQTRKAPEQQRNRIAQQQDNIDAMKERRSAAQRQVDRQKPLVEKKLVDEKDLATSEDRVRELDAMLHGEENRLKNLKEQDSKDDIRRAEKEVEAMTARRDQARIALDECVVKAPRRGTVLRLLAGPGDVLSAQAKQPALQFAIEGPQVVRADVEQEFVVRIAAGQSVQVQDETQTGRTWRGKVERIANWVTQRRSILSEPHEFTDVRTVEVLITLDSDQPALRIGQRVRVRIQ